MQAFSLNIRGRLREYPHPVVMGILNATPDSFYGPSRARTADEISRRAESLVADGAAMIDVGAYSTRPGADEVSPQEEWRRLEVALPAVRRAIGDELPVSVDTFRARVAELAVEAGADIINDVAGGALDAEMFATVARLRVPYVLMHMRGTPATMSSLTDYSAYGGDVATGVCCELGASLAQLRALGVADVIVDPGFGFAKTLEQNYALLGALETMESLDAPILAGLSRKSMITRLLGVSTDDALCGTTALNLVALQHGAAILRVHDPLAACQAVKLYQILSEQDF